MADEEIDLERKVGPYKSWKSPARLKYSPADPTPPRRPKAEAAERELVTQIIGDDAYVTRDRNRAAARKGDMTSGDVAAYKLRSGARPSEVARTFRNARETDIQLPNESGRRDPRLKTRGRDAVDSVIESERKKRDEALAMPGRSRRRSRGKTRS